MTTLTEEQVAVIRAAGKFSKSLANELMTNPQLLQRVMHNVAGKQHTITGVDLSQRNIIDALPEKEKKEQLSLLTKHQQNLVPETTTHAHHKTPRLILKPPSTLHN
jgi:hypothetical protein